MNGLSKRIRAGHRAAMMAALLALAGCAVAHNFRAVAPGQFYRSGQMDSGLLGHTLDRYGIRTVVNLRGAHPEEAWYRDEVTVCEAVGVAHHDLQWSKDHLPDPDSLARFVTLCESSERPLLVHCQGGTHRTGLASACYVLLSGGSLPQARRQLGILFGDAPIGRLLDLYEGSPLSFADWCRSVYPSLYAEETP